MSDAQEAVHLKALRHLPVAVQAVLALEPQIIAWGEEFARTENALFLGRGLHYPIALEGALKLKEISYIHAEAYPAGELKHGPLALVTDQMPVVTIAPNDALLEKLKSNLQEVRARGGQLHVFADADSHIDVGGDRVGRANLRDRGRSQAAQRASIAPCAAYLCVPAAAEPLSGASVRTRAAALGRRILGSV